VLTANAVVLRSLGNTWIRASAVLVSDDLPLDKLIAVCRKRLVDAVVVYRYDRFARSLRQLVNALEEFNSLGTDFVSLHEGDTSSPNGRLFFGIFASIAQVERELIRDRRLLFTGDKSADCEPARIPARHPPQPIRRAVSCRLERRCNWARHNRNNSRQARSALRTDRTAPWMLTLCDACGDQHN